MPSRRMPRFIVWAALAAGACHGGQRLPEHGVERTSFVRGDTAVVEREAAEFFEGRVLSVSGQSLKVQTTEEGEPVVVARGDAYRAPQAAGAPLTTGPAICNDAPGEWHPCLVLSVSSAEVSVRTPSAGRSVIARGRVLSPTPVTALNVGRFFERLDATKKFDTSATRAGDPREPAGWAPERHEPVLVKLGGEWFSAHVDGLAGDGGVRVRSEGDDRPVTVGASSVVPIPPFPHKFVAGEFVLSPPPTRGVAWRRVRIEAASAEEAVVVDDAGEKTRISVRELVPLASAPGP